MRLTRQESTTKLPIPRKGNKYLARASSHVWNSVPVVIAVRDMLNMAKTAKEVREMIKAKILKINGRNVEDYRESIQLFNIFHAGKDYVLTILPTKKFAFEESKVKELRLCKVTNKKILSKNTIQLNLHDGSNILSKDKISVGDSLYIDFSSKIKKHVSLAKGEKVFIMSGKYTGLEGKISNISGRKVNVQFKEGSAELDKEHMIVL